MHLKIGCAKWRPFCPGWDELTALYSQRQSLAIHDTVYIWGWTGIISLRQLAVSHLYIPELSRYLAVMLIQGTDKMSLSAYSLVICGSKSFHFPDFQNSAFYSTDYNIWFIIHLPGFLVTDFISLLAPGHRAVLNIMLYWNTIYREFIELYRPWRVCDAY